MKEKLKKLIMPVCIASAVSLVLSGAMMKTEDKKLDIISDLKSTSENIVIANMTEDNLELILSDYYGNEIDLIEYPVKSKKNVYNTFSELITDGDEVYVSVISNSCENGEKISQSIKKCNFKSNKLNNSWEIPAGYDEIYGLKISDGRLYYIIILEDTVNLISMGEGEGCTIEKTFEADTSYITDWAVTDDMKIIGYSSANGIFEFSENGVSRIFPFSDSENISIANFEYNSENDKFYFSDLIINKNISLDVKTFGYEEFDIIDYEYNIIDSEEVMTTEFYNLKNFSHKDINKFVSVVDTNEDYNQIAICANGNFQIIDNISFKPIRIGLLLKYFICFFILISAITSVVYVCYKKQVYIPMAMKIMLLSGTGSIIAGVFIFGNVKVTIDNNSENEIYNTLMYYMSNISFDLSYYGYYDGIAYNQSFSDELTVPYINVYIADENGDLISANENLPVNYMCSAETTEKYIQSMQDNSAIMLKKEDEKGRWYTLAYPVSDYDGNIIGVAETGVNEFTVNNTSVYNSVKAIFIFLLVLISSISWFIVWKAMKPIKTLTVDLKNGTIKNDNKTFFKHEINDIKDVLENMFLNIKKYQNDMEKSNNVYSRLLPTGIFSIFNKNIYELESGSSQKVLLYNMHIDLNNVSEDVLSNSYNNLVTILKDNKCNIEVLNLKYIEISFGDNQNEIIYNVKNIINMLDNACIGISYGNSISAIIGGCDRLEAIIISKHKKIAEILADIGKRFERNLIVSEQFLKKFSNYQNDFSVRLIGHICVDEKYIKIYDVFDMSDDKEIYIHTKKEFECGVNNFLNNNFNIAKSCFIDVLRYNKNDLIAKQYLDMCELYSEDSKQINTDILSEKRSELR